MVVIQNWRPTSHTLTKKITSLHKILHSSILTLPTQDERALPKSDTKKI